MWFQFSSDEVVLRGLRAQEHAGASGASRPEACGGSCWARLLVRPTDAPWKPRAMAAGWGSHHHLDPVCVRVCVSVRVAVVVYEFA